MRRTTTPVIPISIPKLCLETAEGYKNLSVHTNSKVDFCKTEGVFKFYTTHVLIVISSS